MSEVDTTDNGDVQRTLLVDGSNVVMRAVHAMVHSGLDSADGIPTGPLLVFINTLSRHVLEEQPHRMVVCWDSPSERRKAISADYKGNREKHQEIQETADSTFALAREFCTLAGIPQDRQTGCEADDLIATYWRSVRRHACPPRWQTVILSSDKDFLMLMDDDPQHRTEQVRLSSASTPTDRWDAQAVRDKHGCEPHQLRYAMALAGDTSDNVIGIRGIGMKTAIKLMNRHAWDFDAALDDQRVRPYSGRIRGNLSLVDLVESQETDLTKYALPPTVDFGAEHAELVEFLEQKALNSVLRKINNGTLWYRL